jgi:hypothetical protein
MADLIGLAEIAARLSVDNRTVRRLIAQESENLGIEIQRGKGDKVLLSKDDAERLIASYAARRGPQTEAGEDVSKYDRFGFFYLIQLIPEALPNRVASEKAMKTCLVVDDSRVIRKVARRILERHNEDLERQLVELRRTVAELMRICQG